MNRDIVHVLALSSLAQVAGFAKAIIITYYFGVSALLDGYYLAQAVPAMLAGLLVGFFQTGFTPLYSAHLARGEHDDAAALLGAVLVVAAGIGLVVSISVSIFAPTVVGTLVGAKEEAIAASTITALRALAFLLLLNALVDCLGLALNMHHRYLAAAAAPIVNALAATAILAAAPDWGLTNLIVGTLVGVFLQLLVVLGAAYRTRIRVIWGRYDELSRMFRVGATILPGLAFSNLSLLVPSAFAARLGEGAVTAFALASRLHGALTQVLAIALSTVLLPHFASAIARNEKGHVADYLRAGFPTICAIGFILVLWVGLAGTGVVSLLFKRGSFDAAAVEMVASVWLWLTVGLVPSVWGIALAKALQAMQLGGTLSRIAALSLASLFLLSYIGVALDSLNIVAYSTALAAALSTVAFAFVTGKRLTSGESRSMPVLGGFWVFIAITIIALSVVRLPPYITTPVSSVLVTAIFAGTAILVALEYMARQRRLSDRVTSTTSGSRP